MLQQMGMTPQELRDRSKRFAIGIVKLCRGLPGAWHVRIIARQLLRSGTGVAANHRACGRARSDREFCAKMGIVVEEADESQLWLELLVVADPSVRSADYGGLVKEATELTAIFTASHRTARENLQKRAVARAHKRSETARR
jgi:four helix bundle protein